MSKLFKKGLGKQLGTLAISHPGFHPKYQTAHPRRFRKDTKPQTTQRKGGNKPHNNLTTGQEDQTYLKISDILAKSMNKAVNTAAGISVPNMKESVMNFILKNLILPKVVSETDNPKIYNNETDKKNPLAGQVVDQEGNLTEELPLCVFIPGFGAGLRKESIRSDAEALKMIFPNPFSIFISPLEKIGPSGNRRYSEGQLIYDSPNFISEASEEFFKKIITPRFLDENGDLLPPNQCKRLLLVAHSIGAREVISYCRYFINYLKKTHSLEEEEIQEYTKKIFCLNVASPFPQKLEAELPEAISIRGPDDLGSKQFPSSLEFSLTLPQSEGLFPYGENDKHTVLHLPFNSMVKESAPVNPKDPLGHGMRGYADHLKTRRKDNKIIDLTLKLIKYFADPQKTSEETQEQKNETLSHRQEITPHNDQELSKRVENYVNVLRFHFSKLEIQKSEHKSKNTQTPSNSPNNNTSSQTQGNTNDKERK